MSEEIAPQAVKAMPKKSTISTRIKKPRTSEMVTAALTNLKERSGSSFQAIKKYMAGTYMVDAEKLTPFIKKYLKTAIEQGKIIQTKGKGASGSFKLVAAAKSSTVKLKAVVKPKSPTKKSSTPKKPRSPKKSNTATKKVDVIKKIDFAKKSPVKKPSVKNSAAKRTRQATSGTVKKPATKKAPAKAKKTVNSPTVKPKSSKPKKAMTKGSR